jgi:hypothetical protein
VTARIRTGRLKVSPSCVNLIKEARLYRYPTPAERATLGENPIDADNHALAALRYLASRFDRPPHQRSPIAIPAKKPDPIDDESLWTAL